MDMMIVQARWMMHRLEDLASKKGLPFYDEWYLEEDQPFLRWLNQIETEGVGDAEATESQIAHCVAAARARHETLRRALRDAFGEDI